MARKRRSLWWRWSWRDLRQHWAAVVSIGAVIAIGTGVYAGLGSTAAWRELSNDASFAELRMHDLRAELNPGTFADAGTMRDVVSSVPHSAWITAADERLVVDSQVDASTELETILVSARVIGAEFGRPGVVDDLWVAAGVLEPAGSSSAAVVLEKKFADYYSMPESGQIEIAGGVEVRYSGLGVAPEEFYVLGPEGSVLAQADLATLYAPLAVAQGLVDRPDAVNDVVLTLAGEADRDVLEAELDAAFAGSGLSATVTTRDEAEAYRILYEDIENDQQIWNALSALVLGAAALAAFNLISRIVEAQRREIGIGMALGAPRHLLAIRPVLVGVQVGVLGTVAGIGVGVLVGSLMRGLMESLVPMPQWLMPFQYDVFLRGALLGVLPPLLAAVLPVWRAVRVEPIEAIRTGHLAAGSGQLGAWTRRVRVPGTSLTQMPLRNLLRAPRRTVLTALGVGAAITALVAVLAMLDSFERAVDRGSTEVTRGDPERVSVALDTFYPIDAPVVAGIRAAPVVGGADPSLSMPASAVTEAHEEIDLVLEVLDLDAAAWTPTITAEADTGRESGVILAEKAARDLGVDIGDPVRLTHPQRVGFGYSMETSEFLVAATHPNPIRNFAFVDAAFAAQFGLEGLTNGLQVTPAPGFDRADVQRAMFTVEGVASAQPVARVGEAFDEAMEQFVGFLVITAGAVLLLALLIAFNSARISVDERRREHATMLAFGVKVRRVVGIVTREAVVVGLLATAVGTMAGVAVLQWILNSLATRTLPDFEIVRTVSPTTLGIAVVVGVLSVSIAPLFLVRRIQRMDLPDTLRVME